MAQRFLAIFLCCLFVTCGKYEEGPGISLRSKKARICGEWKIQSVDQNGVDQTSSVLAAFGSDFVFHINTDGTYHKIGSFEDRGTWKFGHDKEYLLTLSNIPGAVEEHYQIIRLKHKELWIRHTHDIHVTTLKYVVK